MVEIIEQEKVYSQQNEKHDKKDYPDSTFRVALSHSLNYATKYSCGLSLLMRLPCVWPAASIVRQIAGCSSAMSPIHATSR